MKKKKIVKDYLDTGETIVGFISIIKPHLKSKWTRYLRIDESEKLPKGFRGLKKHYELYLIMGKKK